MLGRDRGQGGGRAGAGSEFGTPGTNTSGHLDFQDQLPSWQVTTYPGGPQPPRDPPEAAVAAAPKIQREAHHSFKRAGGVRKHFVVAFFLNFFYFEIILDLPRITQDAPRALAPGFSLTSCLPKPGN